MFTTFEEITKEIKTDSSLPFRIITEGEKYFTVEDAEGYRAYMQVESYSFNGRLDYAMGLSFATVHKPNRKTGTGHRIFQISVSSSLDEIVSTLKETLVYSKRNIVMGKEQMDTRKPHENRKYLV